MSYNNNNKQTNPHQQPVAHRTPKDAVKAALEDDDNFNPFSLEKRDRSSLKTGDVKIEAKNRNVPTGEVKQAGSQLKEAAHDVGVKSGIVEPTPGEKIKEAGGKVKEAAHEAGVKMGMVNPNPGEKEPMPGEKMKEAGRKMKEAASETGEKMGVVEPTPGEKVKEAGSKVKEAAKDVGRKSGVVEPSTGEKLKEKAYSTKETVEKTAEERAHEAKVKLGLVKAGVFESATGVKDTAYRTADAAKEKAHEVGVKMGVVDPTPGEQVKEAVHKTGEKNEGC
jgi:predicted small secreted protein